MASNHPHNAFKAALQTGQQQIGFWLSTANDCVTEIAAGAGFDWLMIDTEHAPNGMREVLNHLRILEAYASSAVVRPAANDPVIIKRLLDLGAQTLLLPMINSKAEAAAAVAAVRYPPLGIRGVSMGHRANRYGRVANYHQRAADEICIIAQIETTGAAEALEEIAGVDGIDGLFIGPGDLSADMGYLGQPNQPVVQSRITSLTRRAHKVGIPIGTLVTSAQAAREAFGMMMTFVAVSSDIGVIRMATDALVKELRESNT